MTARDILLATLDTHLRETEAGLSAATSDLVRALRAAIDEGHLELARETLRRSVVPSLDYTTAQTLARLQQELGRRLDVPGDPVRIAVLSSLTTGQLVRLIEMFLFAAGVKAEVYQSEYGVFRQEILDEGSGLYRFKPRFLFLATCWRDVGTRPDLSADLDAVSNLLNREFASWADLWDRAHRRLQCQIIQNNLDVPPWRALGNHEARHPASPGGFMARMNGRLFESAPRYVTIHDLDHLSSVAGRWQWSDERFYHHAKLPCAPEFLVDYAHSVSSLIATQLGQSRKCLVMDLDNTLWGGVIGDDGLGGIRLGQGDGEGEAYQSFQRYVRDLGRRGVILAVCSKNEEHIAREVFEKHTEMVLRLSDIACFVANWQDKASNLRAIASRLNIGLNSLVFVDDNPMERSIVRHLVPEVAVPELPEDPAGYVHALERHRYFQSVALNPEDLQRTEMYHANVERESAEASAGSLDEFLRSLAMVARVAPIGMGNLERATQLINRSNQFNLTTRRYSAGEIMQRVNDPNSVTLTVSLADRFGDNGLISVIIACCADGVLDIDTWVMSCRVLKRGVEVFVLDHLSRAGLERGLGVLRGEYVPTAKNVIVRDHYEALGFARAGSAEDGRTVWELKLEGEWQDRAVHIEEAQGDGRAS